MIKKHPQIFYGFLIIVATAAAIFLTLLVTGSLRSGSSPAFSAQEDQFPIFREKDYFKDGSLIKEKTFEFADGGIFSVFRFEFSEKQTPEKFVYSIPVNGEDISIRWQNYNVSPSAWEFSEISSIPKATLFIETTNENLILSIPALYLSSFNHKTIECVPDLELPANIEKTDTGYNITMEFTPRADTIGELWFYKCKEPLIEWDEAQERLWLRQDLYKNRRFCFDGYYFRTYNNYIPYSDNGFFRNAANFTGAQILESATGSARNIGYAMTKICVKNQNSYGFWETGPMSAWLYKDYGIGYNFYDTRFSTDFARSLLIGYSVYDDNEFLHSALKYADFLTGYAESEGHRVGENKDGILVPDYWSENLAKKPHTSLNHQLAEINFLLETFIVTGEQKYKSAADKMLKGIENTADEWILEDNNLRYALMYEDSSNVMVDYPYLTYNDLYDLRLLLERLNETNGFVEAIERLMDSKKAWMDENGVTEYKK